ncbi:MAG: ThuA domain-containing protein [Fimbriimonadaceae bacterium]|nr:ThuA domain-containing protein [Fimbriimonadaceae bacterium]
MPRGRLASGAWAVLAWLAVTAPASAMPPLTASPEETARIQAALPAAALVKPLQPRRLLIFDLNVIYGGHGSISTANTAFTLLGQRTGAWETVVSRDPAVFAADSLRTFDAVFFNNTVGNQFEDPTLRRNLLEFVLGGGGLMGVHGTTVGFTRWNEGAKDDWPEFGLMIGARGAAHGAGDEAVVVRNEDPSHPVSATLPAEFEANDEFFRYGAPYSRDRVRVLLSLDNAKSAARQGIERLPRMREDDDYPVAWVRNYGQGRVFYCSLAHQPKSFWDPALLRFYLAGVQFILGDLPAPTIPSAKLTPALRAQEQLGWRLGVEAYTFHRFTLFEAIDKVAQLGLPYMGGLNFQKVSASIPKNLDPNLTDDEIQQVRLKLDAAGVRMLTYYYQNIPGDEAGCRKVFDFGRKLGIACFMAEPAPEALPTIDRYCQEYRIQVALHNHDQQASPHYWSPEALLRTIAGRSRWIGACADVGYWMRGGQDPIAGVRALGDRLLTLQMHDLHALTADGHDVPWGTGAGQSEKQLLELHKLGVRPTMVGLEYSYNWLESLPEIAQTVGFFNELSLRTAAGGKP